MKETFTEDSLKILANAARNIFSFAKFARIIHPILGNIPFELYPFQKRVLWEFINHRFNIVLKARQMGLTETIALYVLWIALFSINKNIVIISLKDRVAKRVLRRIKHMYKYLPPVLQTPIINGRRGEYGTACITPDTLLVGRDKDFRIGEYVSLYGIRDVSDLNLEVLTHDGTFKKVKSTINKGVLETWEIKNDQGKTLKCTPDHRLFTTEGWKTVKEIITRELTVIFWDPSYLDDVSRTITTTPDKEVFYKTQYRGYLVSNLGFVYSTKSRNGKGLGRGHVTYTAEPFKLTSRKGAVKLRLGNKQFVKPRVHRLVYSTIIGPIPEGYIIDHIDGDQDNNCISNLQAITPSENTKRAYTECRNLVATNHSFKTNTIYSLSDVGLILEEFKFGNSKVKSNQIVELHGIFDDSKAISRIRRGKFRPHIYVSKITKVRSYSEIICDLEVEDNHSYITKDNFINHNSEMEFANGSIITSIPTTEDAGRSEAVSLLVMDETAIMQYAEVIWTAAAPTLFTGGSAILNSTPFGLGNFFHGVWVDGLTKSNQFNNIQIPWHLHPDRDEAWYSQMYSVLGPRRAAQEIDCDFLASGNNVFDPMDLKSIQDGLIDHPVIRHELQGNLLVFEDPIPNVEYFLGGDVATGRAKDYSAFSIMDKHGDEKACFKGRIPTNRFRNLVGEWGIKYNQALVGVEGNDIGEAVVMGLEEQSYPNMYYTVRMLKEKGDSEPKIEKIPGWYTTSKNRPIIIDGLERDIREEVVTIKNPFFIAEGYTFVYDASNRPVAMQKGEYMGDGSNTYSDDSIMSTCITNHIRKGNSNTITTTPR